MMLSFFPNYLKITHKSVAIIWDPLKISDKSEISDFINAFWHEFSCSHISDYISDYIFSDLYFVIM